MTKVCVARQHINVGYCNLLHALINSFNGKRIIGEQAQVRIPLSDKPADAPGKHQHRTLGTVVMHRSVDIVARSGAISLTPQPGISYTSTIYRQSEGWVAPAIFIYFKGTEDNIILPELRDSANISTNQGVPDAIREF